MRVFRHRLRWILPALVLAAGMYAWRSSRKSVAWSPAAPPSVPRRPRPAADPALAREVLRLEEARSSALASVWAPEAEAERHEEFFVQLWDALRTAEDPLTLLAELPVETLAMPATWNTGVFDRGIDRLDAAPGRSEWVRSRWRKQVLSWKEAGWRLAGSEWRMPAFVPATPDRPATSRHSFRLLLGNAATSRRLQFEGEFEVDWNPSPDPASTPTPRQIRVLGVAGVASSRPPGFERVASASIDPLPGRAQSDPLVLRDLDGDGRDEIVLVGRNRVYLNRGPGGIQGVQLCPTLPEPLGAALFADVTGDGLDDLVGADSLGLVVVAGTGKARFDAPPRRTPLAGMVNPWVLSAGDVDGDGDADLWIGQYKVPYLNGQMPFPFHDADDGFPSYLLLNDGSGGFQEATERAGLGVHRHRRLYSGSLVDLDDDGDLDLVQVSDFAGVDLFLNDGHGRFREASERLADPKLFGMAHVVADLDGDRRPDLLALGMDSAVARRLDTLGLGPPDRAGTTRWRSHFAFGNRVWLGRDGEFAVPSWGATVAATGWNWGAVAADFDGDGDLDLFVANGHKSRESARDYETEFWTSDIYQAVSTNLSPALDLYFQSVAGQRYGRGDSYGGHQHNRLLQRGADGSFRDTAWIHGIALEDDSRNLATADLDGDGRLDLVVTTVSHGAPPGQRVEVFRGAGDVGRWTALRVPEIPGGPGSSGGRVDLVTNLRTRSHWIVTGDGYRTQQWPVARFALAEGEEPKRFEVRHPGGRARTLTVPPEGAVSVLKP